MLQLIVDNTPLDLSDDFTLTLEKVNPMFNDLGDASYAFTVPATAKNKRLLGWYNRVETTRDQYEEFPVNIMWGQKLLFSGLLKMNVGNSSAFEGVIYFDKGSVNYLLKTLLITQIDFGHEYFDTPEDALAYFNDANTKYYPDVPVALPEIYAPNFLPESSLCDDLKYINRWFYESDWKLHLTTYCGEADVPDPYYTILIPMLYLRYVLKTAAEELGYYFVDNFFNTSTALQNLVIYNSMDTNRNDQSYHITELYFTRHLPKVELLKFLQGIERWFNCCFHWDEKNKTITVKGNEDVVFNQSDKMEFSSGIISMRVEGEKKITGIHFFNVVDPDDEIISEALEYEEDHYGKFIKGSVSTRDDLPVFPFAEFWDLYYVEDEDKWYEYWMESIGWLEYPDIYRLLKDYYHHYPQNEDNESSFSTLFYAKEGYEIGMALPEIVSVGNTHVGRKDITPRLFFVKKELVSAHLKMVAHTIDEDLSLYWCNETATDSEGIFKKFWKRYIDWIMYSRKTVIMEKVMTMAEFDSLSMTKKLIINGNDYIINSMTITLGVNEIKPVKFKLYSVV